MNNSPSELGGGICLVSKYREVSVIQLEVDFAAFCDSVVVDSLLII